MAEMSLQIRRGLRTRSLAAAALVLATACEQPAVSWVDADSENSSAPSPLAHPPIVPIDSTMNDGTPQAEFLLVQDLMREAGAATLITRALLAMPEAKDSVPSAALMPVMNMAMATQASLGDGDAPADSARCVRSLRIALAPGRGRVAVWWSRRANSRVWLQAAWRDSIPAEGRLGPWRGPIVIDSVDQGPGDARAAERGAAGCARPAPGLVVDDLLGYVHVAYVLVGPEGAGVFYAHQMDPRAAFEPPVAIVYGDRLGAARVAASGNVVAVAYEDPNSGARPRIGLAVSRVAGHLFEERMIASGTTAVAHDPYVAVRGRAVVEGWSEVPVTGGAPVFRTRRARVR
ncbi:MAG: hypothetical protein IPP90_03595 [Gemmatimonadaceae bacterium]|nr:hypothetical protein [Gemmatimonadaceae bacterium]